MKFDKIVSNPPFSLDKWGAEDLEHDIYGRFEMGLPPKSKGDYAFISHILASLNENGTAAIILPHGALFRAAGEGKIRTQIVEKNWLDAIIGLPENLFFGTPIPTCILLFKKNKKTEDVLFIDASKEFEKDVNQYKLTEENIKRIIKTYNNRAEIDKYSHIATLDEIINKNKCNLNIARYIDMFEEEELIDIEQTKVEITKIENELKKLKSEIEIYTKELGL